MDLDCSEERTKLALRKIEDIFSIEAEKSKSDEKTLKTALKNIRDWLMEERFSEYKEALLDLIDLSETDRVVAKELYDSFWRTVPFGTGGRRWRIGIGPNRMNAYMAAITVQGHVEYLKKYYGPEIKRGDVVAGAYDVRKFKKYFAETKSMKKYREIIEEKCPALKELSSEDLSKIAGLVYSGNGIRYIHASEIRTTPWVSFVVNRFGKISKDNFSGKEGNILKDVENVMAGIVLSSSHNPYDNNGTKFYENSGAQASPDIAQKLMDLGNSVTQINYYGKDSYYNNGLDETFKKAVDEEMVIFLDGDNLRAVDGAYFDNCIEEIKSVYTAEEWEGLKTFFNISAISFNSLNGTGSTNLDPILKKAGFRVLRNYQGDIPDWEFCEGYGNIPNPEAEKSFNTTMEIGIRRSLDFIFDSGIGKLKIIIDEDYNEIPFEVLESEFGKNFLSSEELINHMKSSRSKFIRGYVVSHNEFILNFEKINNICLMTDPDADRVGLGMKKIEETTDGIKVTWVSANDNDESGIILFRYRLEKLREIARRGELINHIEGIRRGEGKGVSLSGKYQLIMVNTVVTNPLENIIAEKISEEISKLTDGRVVVKVVTQHVGFKFTGEIIDNINKEEFNGITGEIMKRQGINLNEAFFVISCEEGEGAVVGFRGSIDKDTGTTGLLLSVLAAEQLSSGKTIHDYLMETYRIFGYSKSYVVSMVMTGEYGFRMINEKILNHLRNEVLDKIKQGEKFQIRETVFHKGMDHYDFAKPMHGEDVEAWPQATRESLNILEFYSKFSDGTKVKFIARPSGTEPKHKNIIMVVGSPLGENEDLIEYIKKINELNQKIIDEVTIECYKFSDAEYSSFILERPLKYRVSDLSFNDLKELVKIFHIVVPYESKMGVYFPLRDYIKEISTELASLSDSGMYEQKYDEIRKKIENYLINFKEKNGIEFIEEAVILNLRHQIEDLISSNKLNDDNLKIIHQQAFLWFGKEIGNKKINHILKKEFDKDIFFG